VKVACSLEMCVFTCVNEMFELNTEYSHVYCLDGDHRITDDVAPVGIQRGWQPRIHHSIACRATKHDNEDDDNDTDNDNDENDKEDGGIDDECGPIENQIEISVDVNYDCTDDHCAFACLEGQVNIAFVSCVANKWSLTNKEKKSGIFCRNQKKDKKKKKKDKKKDKNEDDTDDDHYSGPLVKECQPFAQFDDTSVRAKCKGKTKCMFLCLKGFANVNQKSTHCVDGNWALRVDLVRCEAKKNNGGGYGRK